MMKKTPFQVLAASTWIIALNAMGALIGSFIHPQTTAWYRTLNHAPFTPPSFVFLLIWPALYTLLGLAGWLLWQKSAIPHQKKIRALFCIQLMLNWLWPILFFSWHHIGLSFVCIIAMISTTAAIGRYAMQRSRAIPVLLLPYLLWLCFAAYLNLFIWLYN